MEQAKKTSTPHLTWTDDSYQHEQALTWSSLPAVIAITALWLAVSIWASPPPQELKDTAQVVVEGLNAALSAVKPGITCEEVELVWRKIISKADLEKESRIRYSIGLNYPPDWCEHTASLRSSDETVLEPNMTFHMILGMWIDNWGFVCSESFRVTKTGCELFARFPRKLFVKSRMLDIENGPVHNISLPLIMCLQ